MSTALEFAAKWNPVDGLTFAFISAELHLDYPSLAVRLVDGRVERTEHEDLVLLFKRVAAFSMHEEFVHPTQGTVWGKEPTISGRNDSFPCLLVSNSPWFESLRIELEINYPGAVHYRLCTSFPVVDIATAEVPAVWWYRRAPTEQDARPLAWAVPPNGAA